MQTSSDLPLNPPFRSGPGRQETLVQDRPTLGAMPLAHRGASWWLLPGIDFISSSIALAAVATLSSAAVAPAVPVAPLVLILAYSFLGVYGASPSKGGLSSSDGAGWPVIHIVVAGLFAWVASLMTTLGTG